MQGAQWKSPGTHGYPTFGPEGGDPPDVLVRDVDRHGQGGGIRVTQLVVVVGLRHSPALVGDALVEKRIQSEGWSTEYSLSGDIVSRGGPSIKTLTRLSTLVLYCGPGTFT